MEQQVGGKQDVLEQHQVVTKQQSIAHVGDLLWVYTSFRPAQEAPLHPCCGMKM